MQHTLFSFTEPCENSEFYDNDTCYPSSSQPARIGNPTITRVSFSSVYYRSRRDWYLRKHPRTHFISMACGGVHFYENVYKIGRFISPSVETWKRFKNGQMSKDAFITAYSEELTIKKNAFIMENLVELFQDYHLAFFCGCKTVECHCHGDIMYEVLKKKIESVDYFQTEW